MAGKASISINSAKWKILVGIWLSQVQDRNVAKVTMICRTLLVPGSYSPTRIKFASRKTKSRIWTQISPRKQDETQIRKLLCTYKRWRESRFRSFQLKWRLIRFRMPVRIGTHRSKKVINRKEQQHIIITNKGVRRSITRFRAATNPYHQMMSLIWRIKSISSVQVSKTVKPHRPARHWLRWPLMFPLWLIWVLSSRSRLCKIMMHRRT